MNARSTDLMRDMRCAHEARLFVDMLQSSRLVLLFGDHGAGKTVLLRDWVIPALRAQSVHGEVPHVVYFDGWNENPLAALDAQIETVLPAALVRQADTPLLRYGPWVDRLSAWTARPGQRLILVFDHFEGYLAATAGESVDAFAREWIAALAAPALRVQFLVAMRAAAEPLLMQRFAGRIAALGDDRVVLPPPRRRTSVAPERDRGHTDSRPQAPLPTPRLGPAATSTPAATSVPTTTPEPAAPAGPTATAEPTATPAPIAKVEPIATPAPIAVHGIEQLAGSMVTARPRPANVSRAPQRAATAGPSERTEPVPPSDRGSPPKAAPAAQPTMARRASLVGGSAPARAEPWLGPGARAPRREPAAVPASDMASTEIDLSDDDLFGPEPEGPPTPRPRRQSVRRRVMRWGAMALGIGAAAAVSAVLLVPTNDFRIPLRARSAAATASGQSVAAISNGAPSNTATRALAPGPTAAEPPLPPGAAAALAPLPPGAPTAQPASPAADRPQASAAHTPPSNVAQVTTPPAPPSPSKGRLVSPPDPTPRAPAEPLELDAATVIAHDLGTVLAGPGGTPYVRAGIGATAANGPRTQSDLFIARYDVLDAMRGADSGDSRNIDGLRILLPLQVEPVYFAVRRDEPIRFVDQIADRRINLGAGGTDAAVGAAHLYRRLFDVPIGSQRATYMPDSEALTALVRERSVDVAILVGRSGFSALMAQQSLTPGAFKLLAFDSASSAGRRALRSYLSMDLPPSPGNPWLDHRLPALAVMSFLVGRGVDEQRTGNIVRTLCQQRDRLRSTGHPYWLLIGFNPVNAPGWRYAAGAERELRACSARWSARPDPRDPAQPGRPMMSRHDDQRSALR